MRLIRSVLGCTSGSAGLSSLVLETDMCLVHSLGVRIQILQYLKASLETATIERPQNP